MKQLKLLKMTTRLVSTMIALTLTINSSVSLADEAAKNTCPPAVYLKVGDKVTDCNRIGLNEKTDLLNRKQLVEGDYNIKIIDEQKKVIDLKDLTITDQKAQSDLWKQEADRERAFADKERDRNSTSFWIGIAAGILLTIGAGYAVGQAANHR